MTTKELEHLLYKTLWKKGWYGVFECAIPKCLCRKLHRERVDMLTYETTGIWRSYELKISKQDLYSSAALSWIGHYNYLVVTEDLVEEAKKILPKDIGIYAAYERGSKKWIDLVRNPRKRELLCKHEDMQFAMLQALSREYKKYRKLKENEEKKIKKKTTTTTTKTTKTKKKTKTN